MRLMYVCGGSRVVQGNPPLNGLGPLANVSPWAVMAPLAATALIADEIGIESQEHSPPCLYHGQFLRISISNSFQRRPFMSYARAQLDTERTPPSPPAPRFANR